MAYDDDYFDKHFAPIAAAMNDAEAAVEANRCLYCYDAPCVKACPTHINIPLFIKQIATKNTRGSAKTIFEANALGLSCAKVCPVEVLCEGKCVYTDWQKKPIEIGRLQAYAAARYYETGKKAFVPGPDNGRKVAIIGAGPAGLACAFYLRRLGHPVTIFESKDAPGGLNTFGVAEYKMDKKTALMEAQAIIDMGVDVRYRCEVGKDVKLAEIEREYEAVFIGIGLSETRSMRIPGEGLPGSMDALSFIEHIKNRTVEKLPESRCTVVIGAGNTSIDAVTQSKRIGVPRVLMAYRRGEKEMGAYGFEFELAKSDGVEPLFYAAPKRILGEKKVEGVEFIRTEVKESRVVEIPGSEFTVECDRVIRAIGQAKRFTLSKQAGLKLSEDGRIETDPATRRTSNSKYWAGGDAVNGGKEVVNAAADGKRAAWDIFKHLTGKEIPGPEHLRWVRSINNDEVAPLPMRGAYGGKS